jgi:cell division protease FtsH
MPDNHSQDQQPPRPEGPQKPPLKQHPPTESRPIRQIIFWVVLLIVIPLVLMYVRRDNRAQVQELKISDLEAFLAAGQVTEVKLREVSSSNLWRLEGKYHPENAPADQFQSFRCNTIYTDSLDKLLREHCPVREATPSNNLLGNILLSLLPILVLVLLTYWFYGRMISASGRSALQFGRSRARRMDPGQEKITMKDVAGCEEAKEDMQEIVDFLKDPEKFRRLGGKIPRGALLIGPPGTGKTLLAKAIAGEADVPFFSISGSDFVEMFVGVGASRVRDMFQEGKKNAPCLIFIDEIDAVGRSRFTGLGGGNDEREQTLNALLVEMDGFEQNSGVIVLAATNRPDVLDPALLRPGRFDRQITVDLPDMRGRLAILGIHVKKVAIDPEVDLRVIARGTPGFSGADLANLVNEAALLATRRNLDKIGLPELEEARDKVRWGKERRSRRIDDKDRRLTAFHESGHALVVMCCENAAPLHKITIVPRGNAYLGATMELPEQDKVHMTKLEILDHIAVCMGGRTAEELEFGDVTTGASMDIQQATDMARKMVCSWGMSEKLGFINYGGRESHIFIGRDITRSEDFSPETAREIDMEVRRIIDTQQERVRKILTDNRDKLTLLAETLLERETLTCQEAYELLGWPLPESKRSPEDLASDLPPAQA